MNLVCHLSGRFLVVVGAGPGIAFAVTGGGGWGRPRLRQAAGFASDTGDVEVAGDRRPARVSRAHYGYPQSNGCVEMPITTAGNVWPYTLIGTLVTVVGPAS